jgi:predicted GH43/DUF377 family glycosyl hydrolase
MRWRKLGRIFRASGQRPWMHSHSACPVALPIGDSLVRIYFATRDLDNRPSVGFLVVDMCDPLSVLEISEHQALQAGEWGMFDDNGVYPGCLIPAKGGLRLYYMGRSNGVPPLYNMAIGLAESRDGGRTFGRVRPDPILGRSPHDPWMTSTPFVLKRDSNDWLMWYLSGIGWKSVDPPRARYNIKIARSRDGVTWSRDGTTAFDFEGEEMNLASPCIWQSTNGFSAMFCSACSGGGYTLQGASSKDYTNWSRTGIPTGLELSSFGWDSESMSYPSSFVHDSHRYILYSGNSNGRDGFGIAVEDPL